jgi:hypothetical protein
MTDSRSTSPVTSQLRHEHVPGTILLVTNVSFIFENSQKGSHSRIAGGIRDTFLDLGGGSLPALVEDVHNLPLAAA